jgi:hypothetical protein
MGERMTKNLVSQSLFRAVSAKRPAAGLIHHSDRGSQYCALEYRKLLEQFGMQASMSRRGNCYDNAPIESFWGTLKNELVHHRRYSTRSEAKQEITEYTSCPAVYESLRTWLSAWLGVHAKEIGLSGSARLGASLAPGKLGKKFGNHSDLDLFIVSPSFFQDIREEFRTWSFDYECNRVVPKNQREASFWSDNNARGPKMIDRGFIDQKMIPNLPEYPFTKKISQGMWLLVEKLKKTPGAPQPSMASLRCYASWDSFVRQVVLSLS